MSVLQVYLSWANSVLCEVNSSVDTVSSIQEGRVLCELIDVLAPEAGLLDKVQASGKSGQRAFIYAALDHMKNHGIKIVFSTQDIMDGDIKSLLDVMWLLILNYGIHFIGNNSFQRSAGVGKKNLLDWCQGELDVDFDPKNSLTFNLCTGNWFTKLLQIFAGSHIEETEDKVSHLYKLLQEIEERYGIRRTIISPNDIVDGTVDEHTLMIYLSLLKRRVCTTIRSARREMLSVEGKEAALAKVEERTRSASEEAESRRLYSEQLALKQQQEQEQRKQQQQLQQQQKEQQQLQQQQKEQQQREQEAARTQQHYNTVCAESSQTTSKSSQRTRSHASADSDWFSSESNSFNSGQERASGEKGKLARSEGNKGLMQTISEKIQDQLVSSDYDEDKDTDVSQGHSEKETESMSEFSSSALDEGYGTIRTENPKQHPFQESPTTPRSPKANPKPKDKEHKKQVESRSRINGEKKVKVPESTKVETEKPVNIKISRPKDYFLQWEETIDRLSLGPSTAPDVSDMSPRSSKQILHGISQARSPRSRSQPDEEEEEEEKDVYGEPVWKRREYFEKKSASPKADTRKSPGLTRSKSLPTGTSRPYQSSESRQREKNGGNAETHDSRRERSDERKDREDSSLDRDEVYAQTGRRRSSFMKKLDELQKRGLAQRVILPELGKNTPVVMVPGQGEDVMMLFEALRQARLDVDANMTVVNGASSGKSSPRRSPSTEQSEETDLKDIQKSEKSNTRPPGTPPTTQESERDISLPRPTAYQHRAPKPLDMRVADLRTGVSRDPRRTQSLTEKRDVSPLATSPSSPRYRSLSPEHDTPSSSNLRDRAVRSRSSQKGVRWEIMDTEVERSSRGNTEERADFQHDDRNYVRTTSPRSPSLSRTPERLPRLELPEDLVSPRPRVGGLGRVPRREAWERQRQRREVRATVEPGTGSTAQAKFIEVLSKEIEELKQKIEVIEDAKAETSLERGHKRTWQTTNTPTSTGNNDSFFTAQSEIQESENKMLLTRRNGSPKSFAQRSSWEPRRQWEVQRSSSSPPRLSPRHRSPLTSLSPGHSYNRGSAFDKLRGRQSPSPPRYTSGNRSPKLSPSPGRAGQSISLGYKSPIRSVTQEIWGKDLTAPEGMQSERRDHYRKLISQTSLSEEDIIELKQSLASAVVENDILEAKLKNARHEIQEKLNKTNHVLDDCRRHLARSQAENMELRTSLEREKERANKSETHAQNLQQTVQQIRADNHELEDELDHTMAVLEGSKPGLDALKQEHAQLLGRTSVVQDENSSLKKEMESLRKTHFKSVSTIRELRNLLDEMREERSALQQKLSKLERTQNETKVRSIMNNYNQEKGAKDETEHEYSSRTDGSSSERLKTSQGYRPAARSGATAVPANKPQAASTGRGLSYSYEDLSPVVPSTYREIYPHRKPRGYQIAPFDKYGSPERHNSPVTFIDYPDLEHLPTKLHHFMSDDDDDDHRVYRTTSQDRSPIYKPIPHRPYSYDSLSDAPFIKLAERAIQSARDSRSRSRSPHVDRSPVRLSLSSDRLNKSHDDAMYPRSTSSSPGRYEDVRRGILKNGALGSRSLDRSPSPRYAARSHSPPTRLPPDNDSGKTGGRKKKKKLVFTKTAGDQTGQGLSWEEDSPLRDELRPKHSSMSWFQLQLENPDHPDFLQSQGLVSRDNPFLSDDQRRYANTLIKKYTGMNA